MFGIVKMIKNQQYLKVVLGN